MIAWNKIDVIIEGYQAVNTGVPLVVGGGENYRSEFHQRIERLANESTHLVGHIHDQQLLW